MEREQASLLLLYDKGPPPNASSVCIHMIFQPDLNRSQQEFLPPLSYDRSCVALEASVETQYAPPSIFLLFISVIIILLPIHLVLCRWYSHD